MFTLRDVFFAFVVIAMLILGGRFIKLRFRWIQMLYLPESIVAGALALILGPQILGAIATALLGEGSLLAGGLFFRTHPGGLGAVTRHLYQHCLCGFIFGRIHPQSP